MLQKATKMQQRVYFLLVLTIVGLANAESANYTWENYEGEVPKNALVAGYGQNETHIYIGQGPYEEKIMAGKIYRNDSNVYFEFGGKGLSTNESVKILCSDDAESFHWIPIYNSKLHKLREKTTFVEGGHEPGFLTFIGRKFLDGKMEVGKIICGESRCLNLYINKDGKSAEYDQYEVLTYKPDTENFVSDESVEEYVDTDYLRKIT